MKHPEELVQALTEAVPEGIRAILLYGSAAAEDHVRGKSDYNVLILVETLDAAVLQAMAPAARSWQRAGNPPPLLFTPDRLRRSADVFAIEILDLQDRHRVLYGDADGLDIPVDPVHVRRELERELQSNLVRLRQGYLLVADRPAKVWDLVAESLPTFLVLIRAALRLYGASVPGDKLAAPPLLAEHLSYDHRVFEELEEIRREGHKPAKAEIQPYFGRYLRAVEQLLDAVDAVQVRGASGAVKGPSRSDRPAAAAEADRSTGAKSPAAGRTAEPPAASDRPPAD